MLRLFEVRSASPELEAPISTQFSGAEHPTTIGQLLLIGGADGSPGATTIAINLAFELALAHKRVCLIDADLKAPSLMTALNQSAITAGLLGAIRLNNQNRLSAEDINRLLMVLNFDGTKISILPGLASPQPIEVATALATLKNIYDLIKTDFDFIIFDCGGYSNNPKFSLGLAEFSKQLFVACSADSVGVERLLWLPSQLANAELLERFNVIVTKVRDGVLGANPKREIADTLARLAATDVCCFVPHDQTAFDLAQREGLPLHLIKKASPARHALSMLARQGVLNQRSNLDWRLAKSG